MTEEYSAPEISRREFILVYFGSEAAWDRARLTGRIFVARCHCSEEECRGWCKGYRDSIEDYLPGGFDYRPGDPPPFDGPLADA